MPRLLWPFVDHLANREATPQVNRSCTTSIPSQHTRSGLFFHDCASKKSQCRLHVVHNQCVYACTLIVYRLLAVRVVCFPALDERKFQHASVGGRPRTSPKRIHDSQMCSFEMMDSQRQCKSATYQIRSVRLGKTPCWPSSNGTVMTSHPHDVLPLSNSSSRSLSTERNQLFAARTRGSGR